jgi:putative ABC transport system permease protein
MYFTDVFTLSFNAIRERKFRFVLNLLGILIGCTAVTGLVSVTQGMNTRVNDQLDLLGANTIMILPGGMDDDNVSPMAMGSQVLSNPRTLSWRDRDIISKFNEIDKVAELQSKYGTYTIRGEVYTAQVMGIGHEMFQINTNFEVEQGRTFTRSDKSSAIIGAKIAHPDQKDTPILKVGDRLRIKTLGAPQEKEMTFRVVGVLKETGSMMGANPDQMIMIPIRTSEQLYEAPGQYTMIQASIRNIDDIAQVSDKIEDTLDDVFVANAQMAQEIVEEVTSLMESVLGGIAAISLFVAGIGIVNTMTVSVNERTREIGTLKALGAKRSDVLSLFISEAAYTGVTGGVLGGAFGFIIGRIIGNYVGLPVNISFPLWISITFFAIIVSILAGAGPAWRAATLDPVDALKHE